MFLGKDLTGIIKLLLMNYVFGGFLIIIFCFLTRLNLNSCSVTI
jgi:hypothetical protein